LARTHLGLSQVPQRRLEEDCPQIDHATSVACSTTGSLARNHRIENSLAGEQSKDFQPKSSGDGAASSQFASLLLRVRSRVEAVCPASRVGDFVDVWRIVLPLVDSDARYFTREEEVRARKYRQAKHGELYLRRRAAVRRLVATYVATEPDEIIFDTTCSRCGDRTHGKPTIREQSLDLSWSAAGDVALLAIGHGYRIGADVERLDQTIARSVLRDTFDLLSMVHDEPVAAAVDSETFLRSWVRYEALVKAIGVGVVGDSSAFVAAEVRDRGWRFIDLEPFGGYVGCVATQLLTLAAEIRMGAEKAW
jgi:phosphopantetheinyl transferase